MTIKRAREIFGSEIQNMTNDAVAEMIERDTAAMRGILIVFEEYLTNEKSKCDTGYSEEKQRNLHQSIS